MKTKLVYLLVTAAMLFSSASSFAQNKKYAQDKRQRPSREEMQKMRVKHLIDVLMLDDETTVKFTSLYESYMKELQACMPEQKMGKGKNANNIKAEKPKELTDKDIEKNIKERFTTERKVLDIQENYYKKFSKILTQKQVMKVLKPRHPFLGKGHGRRDRRDGHNMQMRYHNKDFKCKNFPGRFPFDDINPDKNEDSAS